MDTEDIHEKFIQIGECDPVSGYNYQTANIILKHFLPVEGFSHLPSTLAEKPSRIFVGSRHEGLNVPDCIKQGKDIPAPQDNIRDDADIMVIHEVKRKDVCLYADRKVGCMNNGLFRKLLQSVENGTFTALTMLDVESAPGYYRLTDPDGVFVNHYDIKCLGIKSELHNPPWNALARVPIGMKTNYTPAIPVIGWPKSTSRWFNRERKHNFPPDKTLKTIKDEGHCYVLPRAPENSTDKNQVWQLSFALPERILARRLTPFQRKCFVLYRIVIEYCDAGKTGVDTYILKTIFFWFLEKVDFVHAKEDNFLQVVHCLLDFTLKLVSRGDIRHYFNPESSNLLANWTNQMREQTTRRLTKARKCTLKILIDFADTHLINDARFKTYFSMQLSKEFPYLKSFFKQRIPPQLYFAYIGCTLTMMTYKCNFVEPCVRMFRNSMEYASANPEFIRHPLNVLIDATHAEAEKALDREEYISRMIRMTCFLDHLSKNHLDVFALHKPCETLDEFEYDISVPATESIYQNIDWGSSRGPRKFLILIEQASTNMVMEVMNILSHEAQGISFNGISDHFMSLLVYFISRGQYKAAADVIKKIKDHSGDMYITVKPSDYFRFYHVFPVFTDWETHLDSTFGFISEYLLALGHIMQNQHREALLALYQLKFYVKTRALCGEYLDLYCKRHMTTRNAIKDHPKYLRRVFAATCSLLIGYLSFCLGTTTEALSYFGVTWRLLRNDLSYRSLRYAAGYWMIHCFCVRMKCRHERMPWSFDGKPFDLWICVESLKQ